MLKQRNDKYREMVLHKYVPMFISTEDVYIYLGKLISQIFNRNLKSQLMTVNHAYKEYIKMRYILTMK